MEQRGLDEALQLLDAAGDDRGRDAYLPGRSREALRFRHPHKCLNQMPNLSIRILQTMARLPRR